MCPAQRRRKIWDLSTPLDSHEKQHARGCESTRHRPTWCDAWHREQCHSTASIEYDHDLDCIRPARAARCRHLPAAANISGLDITRKERAYFFRAPVLSHFCIYPPSACPAAAAKIWARGLHIPPESHEHRHARGCIHLPVASVRHLSRSHGARHITSFHVGLCWP